MPAMLDDPSSPTIYRTSGAAPPGPPLDVYPRQVTLRDRVTRATIVPFTSQHQVPPSLLAYLSDQLNREIEMGDTYPMIDSMPVEKFSPYWFQNFAGIMLLGTIESADEVVEGRDWARDCLGSFYIKPNYPGRSSHVCNAGFLVTDASRNRGVGRLMGESYLAWAPCLGYTYSVFNLVYETNVASCRIWDALGFKRIGRVKGAGNLKGHDQLVDAIIYGRDLGNDDEEDLVGEDRFQKIKFYLRTGKYPASADRAEKSRLRSAATHYKLLPDSDTLMLKDKEVISSPQQQYEIAMRSHAQHHGGINKTTAAIAEKYHWVRIKETVSVVIKNCEECKELGKQSIPREKTMSRQMMPLPEPSPMLPHAYEHHRHEHHTSVSPQVLNKTLPGSSAHGPRNLYRPHPQAPSPPSHNLAPTTDHYLPVDPQLMEDVHRPMWPYGATSQLHSPHNITNAHSPNPSFTHHDDSFQEMLVEDLEPEHERGLGGADLHEGADGQEMVGLRMQRQTLHERHSEGIDSSADLDMLLDPDQERDVDEGGDSAITMAVNERRRGEGRSPRFKGGWESEAIAEDVVRDKGCV